MIRIVKMTFNPDKVDEFLEIFNQNNNISETLKESKHCHY